MKRIVVLILALAVFFMFGTGAMADPPSKVIGDAHSIDTKYAGPFNVNLEEWFAAHPLGPGQALKMEPIFQTPRVTVMAAIDKGQLIDLHYHMLADEIVIPIKGRFQEYVDGKWVVIKPGDIQYNPRGIIHATRPMGNEPFMDLSIFTPTTPATGDRVFLNSAITTAKPGATIGDWALLDTQYKKSCVINLDDWYAAHPPEAGKNWRIDAAIGTIRNQMMIAQRPTLAVHYHGSADEIIYCYKGLGEMYINGQWVKLHPGEIHFCPRGFIHGIHPVGDGEFKIFAVFTPPQANLSDRIFVDLK